MTRSRLSINAEPLAQEPRTIDEIGCRPPQPNRPTRAQPPMSVLLVHPCARARPASVASRDQTNRDGHLRSAPFSQSASAGRWNCASAKAVRHRSFPAGAFKATNFAAGASVGWAEIMRNHAGLAEADCQRSPKERRA
jgi:hypothetical protein